MTIIMFVELCEALLTNKYDFLEGSYSVPRTFFPGDEYEVESIKEADGLALVKFIDGTHAEIDSEYFVVTEMGEKQFPSNP